MENSKKVFQFSKPAWKKWWNRVDYTTRIFAGISVLLFTGNLSTIRDGLEQGNLAIKKAIWMENTVKNPKSEYLAYLDDESPPTELPSRTALDQFRAEFAKIRESVENPYR